LDVISQFVCLRCHGSGFESALNIKILCEVGRFCSEQGWNQAEFIALQ